MSTSPSWLSRETGLGLMTLTGAPSAEKTGGEIELLFEEAKQRRRRRRLFVAAVVIMVSAGVVIALVNLAGRGSTPRQSSPPSKLPAQLRPIAGSRCQNRQLKVTTLGSLAGAGNVNLVIGFLNVSKTSCTLDGYPVVAALDAHGTEAALAEPLLNGVGGVQSGATSPPTVTLMPGESSSATISGTDMPHGTATTCPSYPSFLVTVPNQMQSVKLPAVESGRANPFPGCSPMTISPVVPGDPALRGIVATHTPVPSLGTPATGTIPSSRAPTPTTSS